MKTFLFVFCSLTLFLSCNKPSSDLAPPSPVTESLNGWQKISTGAVGGLSDIAFSSPANGVLSSGTTMLRSTDSGKTWNPLPAIINRISTVNFLNGQYGYAVGENQFYLTTDGGVTWRPKSSLTGRIGVDVCFLTPSTGYTLREPDGVLKTTDTGSTWQPLATFNDAFSFCVFFLDAQRGWYTKKDSLFRTVNGGTTWTGQRVGGGPILTVFFVDPSNGWLTADTSVYRTTNGGTSWSATSLGAMTADLHFLNGQIGYVSTIDGVWKTTDGGLSWKRDLKAILNNFPELIFLDENTGWVTGNGDVIYRWKK